MLSAVAFYIKYVFIAASLDVNKGARSFMEIIIFTGVIIIILGIAIWDNYRSNFSIYSLISSIIFGIIVVMNQSEKDDRIEISFTETVNFSPAECTDPEYPLSITIKNKEPKRISEAVFDVVL